MHSSFSREELDAINDTLITESAALFLFARLFRVSEDMLRHGNELIFLAIQRQTSPGQWVGIGRAALLDVASGDEGLQEVALDTPFFTADKETLHMLARLSCASVTPPGIYSREQALVMFARGEIMLDRRHRRQSS